MKKILAMLVSAAIMAGMCGCAAKTEAKPMIQVDIESGVFTVTPQEFIDEWNQSLKNFQDASRDRKSVV